MSDLKQVDLTSPNENTLDSKGKSQASFKDYIRLIRVHQYVKNLVIFFPIFFFGQISDTNSLFSALLAFVFFSILASSVYIINDYMDREDDAKHPTKRFRPLASGVISPIEALAFITIFLMFAFIGSLLFLPFTVVLILATYFLLNIAYTLHLKKVAIFDITIISIGFVLRLFAGGYAIGVDISMWMILMTFLLAMFLAVAKRRDDIIILRKTGKVMRKSISGYNLEFINAAMVMLATMVLVSYVMYTASAEIIQQWGSDNIYLTSVFVVVGIMRYMQLTFVEEKSGNPTKLLLHDRMLQLTIVGWLASFAWFIYFV